MERQPGLLERIFERGLWGSRLIMLVGVVASLLLALGTFYLALQRFSERLNLSENRAVTHQRSAISKSKRLKANC